MFLEFSSRTATLSHFKNRQQFRTIKNRKIIIKTTDTQNIIGNRKRESWSSTAQTKINCSSRSRDKRNTHRILFASLTTTTPKFIHSIIALYRISFKCLFFVMLLQRIGKNCRLSLSASLSPARYHIPYRDSLWIEFKFLFQEGGEGGSFNEKQSTSLFFYRERKKIIENLLRKSEQPLSTHTKSFCEEERMK